MSCSVSRWFGDWRHLVEKPVSAEEVETVVERVSIPAYPFYFLLASSTVIATFGLLANSAAVIIGAMIIAPLMSPILSMSYGVVAGKGALTMRSLFVRGDIVASSGLFTRKLINTLRDKLSEMVTMPVILEFGIIPEMILRSTEEANVDG